VDEKFLMRLEEVALNAYPAPRQIIYDGWLLRFTGGPSKRVNSVNVLYPSALPFDEKIAYCKRVFDEQGMPTIFRLLDPFTPPGLPNALVSEGFFFFDPTYVLGQRISGGMQGNFEDGVVRQMGLDEWLVLRAEFGQKPIEKIRYLKTILEIMVPEKVLVGCFVGDRAVACGMAVIEEEMLGYFSIYTHPDQRRKGYARAVMGALTGWGVVRGASFGYLQVEGDNDPALALYRGMGFETCYRYVYWRE
jgi:ribosomal protein S18 acetylase RimI-like enzyme